MMPQVPMNEDEMKMHKPICADFVSFRAGIRCAERVYDVAEIDRLRTQNQALREAVKGFHTWAYGQRKQQSKGGHASFDYMELREQMDIAEAALAQAEGGV